MVQFPRTAQPTHPANRSYADEMPAEERVRKDLYTRYHRNTIQRVSFSPSLPCAPARASRSVTSLFLGKLLTSSILAAR